MSKYIEKLIEGFEEESVDTQEVFTKAELVPYFPTAEVTNAFDDWNEKVREAIQVSSNNWPKGRTYRLKLRFALVPIELEAEFGQE